MIADASLDHQQHSRRSAPISLVKQLIDTVADSVPHTEAIEQPIVGMSAAMVYGVVIATVVRAALSRVEGSRAALDAGVGVGLLGGRRGRHGFWTG